MGTADSGPLPRVGPYSGAGRASLAVRLRDFHPLWSNIPERFDWGSLPLRPVLQPHPDESGWFGLVRFRSPLLTESLLLSFPGGNEMFQFPPLASHPYGFRVG
jgi:hypothetical protein